jgi:hypothetical protein
VFINTNICVKRMDTQAGGNVVTYATYGKGPKVFFGLDIKMTGTG